MSDPVPSVAEQVLNGHPDDVRTFIAIVLAISGAVERIENWVVDFEADGIMRSRPVTMQAMARCFDGLDGEADIAILRNALGVLIARLDALEGG